MVGNVIVFGQVTEMTEMNPGLMLYGFYETPPLDVYTTWSETYTVSVPSDSHKVCSQ